VEAFFFVLFFSLSLVNIFSLGIEGLDCSFPSFFPRQVYQSTDGVLLKNRIELRVLHHIDIPPLPNKIRMENGGKKTCTFERKQCKNLKNFNFI
jgi:hypothetical protein